MLFLLIYKYAFWIIYTLKSFLLIITNYTNRILLPYYKKTQTIQIIVSRVQVSNPWVNLFILLNYQK